MQFFLCSSLRSSRSINTKFLHFFYLYFFFAKFKPPEFQNEVSIITPEPIYYEGSVLLKTLASYFSGGGLSDSPVTWIVSSNVKSFTPPGFFDYTFNSTAHSEGYIYQNLKNSNET